MSSIKRISMSECETFIHRDLSMSSRKYAGRPLDIDGMTIGFVDMERDPPHGGEMHPDGDELLLVVSGRLQVIMDSEPESPCELGPGEACIVPKGEWHRTKLIERTQILYISPGPNSEHRPMK